ncbi:hypothetical protein P3L10_008189 [Capsicum annuum]
MASGNKGKFIAYTHHHLAESSNYRNKEPVHAEQVELLDKRLRILEDEAELLRVTFLKGVEERKKLVKEIQNEFQSAFGYTKRHEQHGLPLILYEESKPTVVMRELRASEAVFQDATRCMAVKFETQDFLPDLMLC